MVQVMSSPPTGRKPQLSWKQFIDGVPSFSQEQLFNVARTCGIKTEGKTLEDIAAEVQTELRKRAPRNLERKFKPPKDDADNAWDKLSENEKSLWTAIAVLSGTLLLLIAWLFVLSVAKPGTSKVENIATSEVTYNNTALGITVEAETGRVSNIDLNGPLGRAAIMALAEKLGFILDADGNVTGFVPGGVLSSGADKVACLRVARHVAAENTGTPGFSVSELTAVCSNLQGGI